MARWDGAAWQEEEGWRERLGKVKGGAKKSVQAVAQAKAEPKAKAKVKAEDKPKSKAKAQTGRSKAKARADKRTLLVFWAVMAAVAVMAVMAVVAPTCFRWAILAVFSGIWAAISSSFGGITTSAKFKPNTANRIPTKHPWWQHSPHPKPTTNPTASSSLYLDPAPLPATLPYQLFVRNVPGTTTFVMNITNKLMSTFDLQAAIMLATGRRGCPALPCHICL